MSKVEATDDKQDGTAVPLPIHLIKSLRRKGTNNGSENGSSNEEGNGNQSDNSALVSLGNASFGFNFDSEEGNSNSEERNGESDSDGGGNGNAGGASNNQHHKHNKPLSKMEDEKQQQQDDPEITKEAETSNDNSRSSSNDRPTKSVAQHPQSSSESGGRSSSSLTHDFSSSSPSFSDGAPAAPSSSSHNFDAEAAVANLQSIASAYLSREHKEKGGGDDQDNEEKMDIESNGGYNTDDEGRGVKRATGKHPDKASSSSVSSHQNCPSINSNDGDDERPKKKKKFNDKKREERNAREKERSFRISKQINELRNLLSSGGVIVPKGTKSSVLTEAANYIRMLQQHQYRSEIDRHQLVQQIQMIGGGAHGPQAAQAIRHVAAKNGVWSLGNFGGVPPKSAMAANCDPNPNDQQAPMDPLQQTKIEEHEYHSVFNNCAVGMAIASMGGAFLDCNQLFCQLSNYTKQEVCSLTIFNLTARQDLQHAFDLISQLISPPMDAPDGAAQQPIVLRGAMSNRNDLGLGVALVKGDDGIAKFFCVTLIKNPASPFDDSRPIPATIELIQGTPSLTRQVQKDGAGLDSEPAFTTG